MVGFFGGGRPAQGFRDRFGRGLRVRGAEREGLPDDVLERCDELASIPQPGGGESLNVAMAGTVALYELARRTAS